MNSSSHDTLDSSSAFSTFCDVATVCISDRDCNAQAGYFSSICDLTLKVYAKKRCLLSSGNSLVIIQSLLVTPIVGRRDVTPMVGRRGVMMKLSVIQAQIRVHKGDKK